MHISNKFFKLFTDTSKQKLINFPIQIGISFSSICIYQFLKIYRKSKVWGRMFNSKSIILIPKINHENQVLNIKILESFIIYRLASEPLTTYDLKVRNLF